MVKREQGESFPVNHGRVFGILYELDLQSSITIIFPERLKRFSSSRAFLVKINEGIDI